MGFGGGDAEGGDRMTQVTGEMVFEMSDGVEIEDGEFAEEEMVDADHAWLEVSRVGFARTEVVWMGQVDLVEDREDLGALDAGPLGAGLSEPDAVLDEMGARECLAEQSGGLPSGCLGAPMSPGDHQGTRPVPMLDEPGQLLAGFRLPIHLELVHHYQPALPPSLAQHRPES